MAYDKHGLSYCLSLTIRNDEVLTLDLLDALTTNLAADGLKFIDLYKLYVNSIRVTVLSCCMSGEKARVSFSFPSISPLDLGVGRFEKTILEDIPEVGGNIILFDIFSPLGLSSIPSIIVGVTSGLKATCTDSVVLEFEICYAYVALSDSNILTPPLFLEGRATKLRHLPRMFARRLTKVVRRDFGHMKALAPVFTLGSREDGSYFVEYRSEPLSFRGRRINIKDKYPGGTYSVHSDKDSFLMNMKVYLFMFCHHSVVWFQGSYIVSYTPEERFGRELIERALVLFYTDLRKSSSL
jgi:hypothetical protein